jgi:hypothetical protein
VAVEGIAVESEDLVPPASIGGGVGVEKDGDQVLDVRDPDNLKIKSTADAIRDLGYPVPKHVLVLNVVRGLPSSYETLHTLITH